jgi:hypothetical protein
MAVEFGEEYEAGADYEFGVDVETGDADTYAAGAEAVDAALGAVRRRKALRGFVPAGAKKVRGMFTYFVQVPTPAATYIGGAGGTAVTTCNTPYQVIDIQTAATAATFNLTSMFIGDTNMFLGAANIPADTFFAAVQNRFVRFTTLQRGQTMQVGFLNITAATTPRTLTIIAKVRSYRRS